MLLFTIYARTSVEVCIDNFYSLTKRI